VLTRVLQVSGQFVDTFGNISTHGDNCETGKQAVTN